MTEIPKLRRASPFLIFVAVITVLISSLLLFIQSKGFATWVKGVAARYIPKDTGIDADFSEFAIQLFPPGVSVLNPVVAVRKKNILNLPEGANVRAKRIDLLFQYLQMFTGKIRIHTVRVEDGNVQLVIDTATKKQTRTARERLQLRWEDLLEIRADKFQIVNTELSVQFLREGRTASALARNLTLSQSARSGLLGYQILMDVTGLTGDFLKGLRLPTRIDQAQVDAWVGSSGAELNRFSLSMGGATFRAKGSLTGNILLPQSGAPEAQLLADVNAEVLGEVPEILRAVGISAKQAPVTGTVASQLQVKGDLTRPLETLKIEGKVDFSHLSFKGWAADRAELSAGWNADTQGGTVTVSSLVLDSAPRERLVPFGGASGGHVEIGPLTLRPGELQAAPISVPLKLDRAHIQWFAGPALKDLYPLLFQVSGNLSAQIKLPSPRAPQSFQALIQLEDVDALDFQFDNQKLGVKRPLSKILSIPKIHLGGAVRIDSVGVHMQEVVATLPRSRFVANGVVDFKKGLDFKAGGPAFLGDVGSIGEIPISGEGTVAAHIHGPVERILIDFDTDLHHANYVNLHLGSVKGRITWDDAPSRLLIRRASATQGDSRLIVDGAVDLGPAEKIELYVEAAQATTRDLIAVFDPLISDISWFPRTLEGTVVGGARVSGGLGKDQLTVVARIQGSNWAYLGETARTLSFEGGIERGTLFVRDVVINKREGQLLGGLSFHMPSQKLNWRLTSQGLQLTDLDWVASLDVPFRGVLSLQSQGEGILGNIESQSSGKLSQLSVRGVGFADSAVKLTSQDRRLGFEASVFGSQAQINYGYDFRAGGASRFEGKLERFDFSPLLLLLNPEVMKDVDLRGEISASMDLKFPSGEFDRASGTTQIKSHQVRTHLWALDLKSPLSFTLTDGSFPLARATWESGVIGKPPLAITTQLQAKRGDLEGTVKGAVELGVLPLLTSSILSASGAGELDLAVRGRLSAPDVFGKATVSEGRLLVRALDNPFESIRAVATIKEGLVQINRLDADLAGGKVSGGGSVDLFTDRLPHLALRLGITRSKIKVYPFQYAQASGTLRIEGEDAPYAVRGELVVDSALSREKMFGARSGASGSKALPYAPPLKGSTRRNASWFALDFRVSSDRGIIVQNDLFDAEGKCELRVVGSIEAPRLLGSVEVIQGNMNFKERAFQIRTGSVTFNSLAAIDPIFAFNAMTDVNGTKVQLGANGKVDSFKVELTSNPAMAETEILNLLALGFTSADARKLNPAERSAVEKSEAFSLVLHSLDFNRELKNKSGFQLQIDEAINPQQGTSAFRPTNQIDTSVSPKLVIKRQVEVLGRQVTLSAGSTVGVGTNTEREVNAETRLTPSLSILGVINSREIPILQNSQVSAGGDLKFQWRLR